MSSNYKPGGGAKHYVNTNGSNKSNSNYNRSNSNNSNSSVENWSRNSSPSTDRSATSSPEGFTTYSPTHTPNRGSNSWIKKANVPFTSKAESRQYCPSPVPSTNSGGSKSGGSKSGGSNRFSGAFVDDCDDDDSSVSSLSSVESTSTANTANTANTVNTESSLPPKTFTLVESVIGQDSETTKKLISEFIQNVKLTEIEKLKELKYKLFIPKYFSNGKPLWYNGDTNPDQFRVFHNYFTCRDKFLKPASRTRPSDREKFDSEYSKENRSDEAKFDTMFSHIEKLVSRGSDDYYITSMINKHLEYRGDYQNAIKGILYLQLVKTNNHLVMEYLEEQALKYKEVCAQLIQFRKENDEKLNNNPECREIRARIDTIKELKDTSDFSSIEEEQKINGETEILLSRLNEIKSEFAKLVEPEKLALEKEKEKYLYYDINKMPMSELSSLHPCSWAFYFAPMKDRKTGTWKMNESEIETMSAKVKSTLSLLLKQNNILKSFNKGNDYKVFLSNLIENTNLHPNFVTDIYNFIMDTSNKNSDFWLKYFSTGLNILGDNMDKHLVYIGLTKFSSTAYTEIYKRINFFCEYEPKHENNKYSASLEKIYKIVFAGNYPTFYNSAGNPMDVEFNRYYDELGAEFHKTLPDKIVSYLLDNFKSLIQSIQNEYSLKRANLSSGEPEIKISRSLFLFLGKAYKLGICRNKIIAFLYSLTNSEVKDDIILFIRSFNHFILNQFDCLADIKFEHLDTDLKQVFAKLASDYTNCVIETRYSSNFDCLFGNGSFKTIFRDCDSSVSASVSASVESKLPVQDSEIMDAISAFLESPKLDKDINSVFGEFISSLNKVDKFHINQPMALAFCEAIASYSIDKVKMLVKLIDNTGTLTALIKAQDGQVPGLFDCYDEYFIGDYREVVKSL